MERILALISILLGLGITSFAQEQELELNDLSPPAFPAATIMGVQPMEIVKPRSYNELETALINNFTEGGAVLIPNDFAMEVMPSWLAKPANKRFINADKLDSNRFSLRKIAWDNLAISIASVNENIGDTSFNTQLGFGIRTKLLEGKLSKGTQKEIAKARMLVHQAQDLPNAVKNAIVETGRAKRTAGFMVTQRFIIDSAVTALTYKEDSIALRLLVEEIWENLTVDLKLDPNKDWDKFKEALQKKADELANTEQRINLAKNLANLRSKRTGFIWEIAAASYVDFPSGSMDYSEIPKVGVWTTFSYTEGKGIGDFSVLVRYINDLGIARSDTNVNNAFDLDIGFRASVNLKGFTLAAEGLMRWKTVGASFPGTTPFGTGKINYTQKDYRLAINASYAFGNKLSIGYTFGKNFDFTEGSDLNLINQLSLNYAFGSVPIKF